jgi:hypothetical protein
MGINDFREKIIVGEKNYCRGLNHCEGVIRSIIGLMLYINIGGFRREKAARIGDRLCVNGKLGEKGSS